MTPSCGENEEASEKSMCKEKVSSVDHSGPPGPPAGDFGHATSISSHKATPSVLTDTRSGPAQGEGKR